MIKFSLGLFLIFLGLVACAQNKGEAVNALEYKEVVFQKSACVGKDSTCAEVTMTYPEFRGENELSTWVNLHIREQMMMYLTWGTDEKEPNSVEKAADQFLKEFIDYGNDFPESVHAWFNEGVGKVSVLEEGLLSIIFTNSSYTGGAHSNQTILFLNFDLEEQKLLKNEDIILDKERLLELAEKAFREYHEVDPALGLEDDGRFFLNEGDFFLPAAIGYEKEELVLIYNSYEIGPYAMGQTEIRLPLSALKGIVRQIKKG